MKFLTYCSNNDDCLKLFASKTMIDQVDFLWSICRPFFITWVFLPFMCLGVLPLCLMAFTLTNIENKDNLDEFTSSTVSFMIFYLSVIAFTVNTSINANIEYQEAKAKGFFKSYIRDSNNWMQILTVILNAILLIEITVVSIELLTGQAEMSEDT